jgi:hypothetical protein
MLYGSFRNNSGLRHLAAIRHTLLRLSREALNYADEGQAGFAYFATPVKSITTEDGTETDVVDPELESTRYFLGTVAFANDP